MMEYALLMLIFDTDMLSLQRFSSDLRVAPAWQAMELYEESLTRIRMQSWPGGRLY